MLDLDAIDVDEIANALADQTDDEHRWLIDPRTGGIAFGTSDLGIDGEKPWRARAPEPHLGGQGRLSAVQVATATVWLETVTGEPC